jgi:hypothetical protein
MLKNIEYRLKFGIRYWKLLVHLIFGTYHFGVNNSWWSRYPSIFGRSDKWNLKRLVLSAKMMRARCFMGFIPLDDAVKIFPEYAARHGFSE